MLSHYDFGISFCNCGMFFKILLYRGYNAANVYPCIHLPLLFIEEPVPNQESELICICVLGVRGHVFVC